MNVERLSDRQAPDVADESSHDSRTRSIEASARQTIRLSMRQLSMRGFPLAPRRTDGGVGPRASLDAAPHGQTLRASVEAGVR